MTVFVGKACSQVANPVKPGQGHLAITSVVPSEGHGPVGSGETVAGGSTPDPAGTWSMG